MFLRFEKINLIKELQQQQNNSDWEQLYDTIWKHLRIKQVPYTLKNKIGIQLEKMRFIKVNELKLTQVELFWCFHFMCVTANASTLFCMVHLANTECV